MFFRFLFWWAKFHGVLPFLSFAFEFAPTLSRIWIVSGSQGSHRAAQCKGVSPKKALAIKSAPAPSRALKYGAFGVLNTIHGKDIINDKQ